MCGAARRDPIGNYDTFFSSYELYAHDLGDPFETARQARYASWLSEMLGTPASAFEGGAGNGSLQVALRGVWPAATLTGIEPSEAATNRAIAAGAQVECGFVTESGESPHRAEIAFAVNVIEHVSDPVDFLRGLAQHAEERVAIVCPDGSGPWHELLFADHLRSLPADAVRRLFAKAGLRVEAQAGAPPGLGNFIMTVGRPGNAPIDEAPADCDPSLHRQRAAYLESWANLDDALVSRAEEAPLVCFGAGEAAAILRAYAPRTWATVTACAVDGDTSQFGALRVVPYASIARATMLLGVQPSAQERLAARITSDGHRALRWDDLIAT